MGTTCLLAKDFDIDMNEIEELERKLMFLREQWKKASHGLRMIIEISAAEKKKKIEELKTKFDKP